MWFLSERNVVFYLKEIGIIRIIFYVRKWLAISSQIPKNSNLKEKFFASKATKVERSNSLQAKRPKVERSNSLILDKKNLEKFLTNKKIHEQFMSIHGHSCSVADE